MIIRKIEEQDAEEYLRMLLQLDKETKFMLYEPGERPRDVSLIGERIRQTADGRNLILVAEEEKHIVGFLSAWTGVPNRIRHSAYIVTGLLNAYRNNGIGSRLFQKLNFWAIQNRITRLELTVMCHNATAIHLYEKAGFEIEGKKRNSVKVDGEYVDEFYMGKLLET